MLFVPAAQECEKLALVHEAELELRIQILLGLQSEIGGPPCQCSGSTLVSQLQAALLHDE
jgi:hypothetical protein